MGLKHHGRSLGTKWKKRFGKVVLKFNLCKHPLSSWLLNSGPALSYTWHLVAQRPCILTSPSDKAPVFSGELERTVAQLCWMGSVWGRTYFLNRILNNPPSSPPFSFNLTFSPISRRIWHLPYQREPCKTQGCPRLFPLLGSQAASSGQLSLTICFQLPTFCGSCVLSQSPCLSFNACKCPFGCDKQTETWLHLKKSSVVVMVKMKVTVKSIFFLIFNLSKETYYKD